MGKRWTSTEIQTLTELYSFSSVEELLKRLPGRSKDAIHLKANGGLNLSRLEHYRLNNQKHINYNKNFFSKPILMNSYFAGLLAADGHIHSDRDAVSLTLAIKDKEQVYRLALETSHKGKVRIRENKSGVPNSQDIAHLHFGCATQWISDLDTIFNIRKDKSTNLSGPGLKDKNCRLSFIIGFLDGDGYISTYTNKSGKYPLMGFVGTKNMLEWIKEEFESLAKSTEKSSKVHLDSAGTVFRYRISGKRAVKILQTLKTIDVPKMPRKWNRDFFLTYK